MNIKKISFDKDSKERRLDRKIKEKILEGDERGVELLIDHYGSFIKSIVLKKIGNRRDYSEECINDIYLSIWKNIGMFDENRNSLKNWIAGVARYKSIDYMRKIYREAVKEDLDSFKNLGQYDPEILKMEADIGGEVARFLEDLSSEEKKIITDLYINEISISSLAELLNMDKKSLYNKIYYIKEKLRKKRGY